MFSTIDSAFDNAILTNPGIYTAPAGGSKALRQSKAAAVKQTPQSPRDLWRCTVSEEHEGRGHRMVARVFVTVTALLSVGSIGYAGWRVLALLGDDRLHDAVGAFAR